MSSDCGCSLLNGMICLKHHDGNMEVAEKKARSDFIAELREWADSEENILKCEGCHSMSMCEGHYLISELKRKLKQMENKHADSDLQ